MSILRLRAAVIATGSTGLPPANGPGYPAKLVRIINPYPAGGAADSLLRPIAQKMSESLKAALVGTQ